MQPARVRACCGGLGGWRWWCVGAVGDGGRVRAGAQPYLGARPGGCLGRRHDGWWGVPAGVCGAAARSIRAAHEVVVAAGAGVELAAVHLGDGERDAHRPGSGRGDRLVAELAQQVIAALENFARDRQARSVRTEPLGGLGVVLIVWAASAGGAHRRFEQRPPQCRRALAAEMPGARRWSDWWTVMSRPANRTASREEENRRASPSSARIVTAVSSPTPN